MQTSCRRLCSEAVAPPDGRNLYRRSDRLVILRRARLGFSQQELAERMGTTASAISRIESGQHRTSTETLRRLAEALEGHAVLGFDFGTARHPEQELVQL